MTDSDSKFTSINTASSYGPAEISGFPNLFLKQTRKGCLRVSAKAIVIAPKFSVVWRF